MKDFIFKNFIFGFIIFVSLFIGFNLYSFAFGAGEYVEVYSSYTKVNNNSYYTYNNPVTKTGTTGSVNATYTASQWASYKIEYHAITSAGDFVIALGTGLSSVMYLQGSPVGYYAVFKGTTKSNLANDATVSISCTSPFAGGNVTDQSSIASDVNIIKADVNTIKNNTNTLLTSTTNIYNDTQEILDILNSLTNAYWFTVSRNNLLIQGTIVKSDNNYYYKSNGDKNVTFTFTDTNFDIFNVEFYGAFTSGSELIFSRSILPSQLTNGSITFAYLQSGVYFDKQPYYIFCKINTDLDQSYYSYSPSYDTFTFSSIVRDPLNVSIPFIENNWNQIEDLQPVQDLEDKNEDVNDDIITVGEYEDIYFDDLNDNLEDFDINSGLPSDTNIRDSIAQCSQVVQNFWFALPIQIQWLFRFVMSMGVILMVLHVGTFNIVKSGK